MKYSLLITQESSPTAWKHVKDILAQQQWDYTRKVTSDDNESVYEDYKKGETTLTLHANTFAGIEISVTGSEANKNIQSIAKALGLTVPSPHQSRSR
jgi:hypothetical protein